MASVLLTGATGRVGSAVAASLETRGVGFRAGARDPSNYDGPGDPVAFDFEKHETWGRAFDGIERLFLVRPPTVGTDQVREAAAAASRCGVERIVFLSVLGAERNPLLPHRRIERHVEELPVTGTFLRASFFMQNLDETHATGIREHGEVLVPAGSGETSFVDARDVGAVGAACLVEPNHEGRAYDLTGPVALDYYDIAAILSNELGRPITYPSPAPWTFARRELAAGRPLAFVIVMLGIYTTVRLGLAGRVSGDVERLLGRPPRSLAEYATDYREAFE